MDDVTKESVIWLINLGVERVGDQTQNQTEVVLQSSKGRVGPNRKFLGLIARFEGIE